MFLKKVLSPGKKEQLVHEGITKQLKLLCSALHVFKQAIEEQDEKLMLSIIDMEREGDIIRRDIVSNIYEGAFLPYLRPDLCKFVEIVDEVFDLLEDAAYHHMDTSVDESIQIDCVQIATLNHKMCGMLLITFEGLMNGDDLREKTLALRIYEKKVDDIKFDVVKKLKNIEVKNFWNGKALSDFMSSITGISDVIEDASDYLQIINVSLR